MAWHGADGGDGSVEFGEGLRDGGGAFGVGLAGTIQRAGAQRGGFGEARANCGFERTAALGDAARQIVLDARAVGVEKLVEVFLGALDNRPADAECAERQVGGQAERRGRSGDALDEIKTVLGLRGERRRSRVRRRKARRAWWRWLGRGAVEIRCRARRSEHWRRRMQIRRERIPAGGKA